MTAKPLRGRLLLLAVTALVFLAALAVSGEAHVKFDNGRWVFGGMTWNEERTHREDPLNIIFMGHSREYSNDNVRSHMKDHAGFDSIHCAGNQRVVWRKRAGSATTSDKQDIQRGTGGWSGCTSSRWHIRGWDDQEHDLFTGDHGRRNQWVLAGVHHEKFHHDCGSPHGCSYGHDIDTDWDVARRKMIEKMAPHCAWPRWKRHLGARTKHRWKGYANSGWIGRISLKHRPNC
jgi:hypothetical protein